MAKRRDRRTRATQRAAERNGMRANEMPVVRGAQVRRNAVRAGKEEATTRLRGRRGVRARRREARMQQPPGGKITNSP